MFPIILLALVALLICGKGSDIIAFLVALLLVSWLMLWACSAMLSSLFGA